MRVHRTLLVPIVALSALAAQAQVAPAPLPPLVTVSGNAEAKATPDMATIRIGVETTAKTAKEAQGNTSALANKVIAAALGIVSDRKLIQTSDLSLNPEYEGGGGFGNGQPPKIAQYRARNIVTIRLNDITKVGPLVDATTDAGATNIDSVAFGLKDDKAARKQAMMDAVREAREKAEALAAGLGLRLGDVFSIDEGGGPIVRPYELANARFAMADKSAPVLPGEVSLSATVTVRFRLEK